MKREILLENGYNMPMKKLKMLKTDLIFHTAIPTFLTKVDSFLDLIIPPKYTCIDDKKEVKYLTKYLKERNNEKEAEEKPPLYIYTRILTRGIDLTNRSTSYNSVHSVNRRQVSFYYLNLKDQKIKKKEKKLIEEKINKVKKNIHRKVLSENFHKPGFIPKKIYSRNNNMNVKNFSSEAFVNIVKKDYEPVKKSIKEEYLYSKKEFLRDVNHKFKTQNQHIISLKDFPENHLLRSRYIKLFPPIQKDYEPKNKLYNIKRIISDYKIDDEGMKKIRKIKERELILEKEKIFKWKKAIISSSIQFKKLGLNNFPIEFSELNSKPYVNKKGKEFFNSIKNKEISKFVDLTLENKLLLLNVDYSHETVLHIMAKRNIYLHISFAIKNGANLNVKNYLGKTPLHLACENYNKESILVLLYEMANPFIRDNFGKNCFEVWKKKNENVKEEIFRSETIKRYELLDKIHRFSIKKYSEYMKNGLIHLWNSEFQIDFIPDNYGIFEKKKKY